MSTESNSIEPANIFGDILQGTFHNMTAVVVSSPLLLTFFVLVTIIVCLRIYRFFRWMPLRLSQRDPIRLFKGSARANTLSRAGKQCEKHGMFGNRCCEADRLEVDHVHPHSRGGSTTTGNAQILCQRHNRRKSNHIPYNWELRLLAKRRRKYFPSETHCGVIRREEHPQSEDQASH